MDTKQNQILNFINIVNELPAEEYLLSMIAYGTAPVIREEKPSSLMTFTRAGRNLYELWNEYGLDVCSRLSLEYTQFRDTKDSVRVLFFKRTLLENCLNKKDCRDFLSRMGYTSKMTLEQCIAMLKERFEHICPHEIGIFLGIPVEDVTGFISHKGENSLLCSYWKVYHNPENALQQFRNFDRARQDIRDLISSNNFNFTDCA